MQSPTCSREITTEGTPKCDQQSHSRKALAVNWHRLTCSHYIKCRWNVKAQVTGHRGRRRSLVVDSSEKTRFLVQSRCPIPVFHDSRKPATCILFAGPRIRLRRVKSTTCRSAYHPRIACDASTGLFLSPGQGNNLTMSRLSARGDILRLDIATHIIEEIGDHLYASGSEESLARIV